MRFVFFALVFIILSCSQSKQSNDKKQVTEQAAEAIPETAQPQKSYSQTVVQVDTLETGDVVKKVVSYQTIDGSNSSSYTYSLAYPKGKKSETPPDLWMLSMYDSKAATYAGLKGTSLVGPSNSTYRFNEKGILTFYKDYMNEIRAEGNTAGEATDIQIGIMDERSREFSWFFVTRNFQEDLPVPQTFLSINGENPLKKDRKNIVDYYVLATTSDIFQPEHSGGQFDVPNGYFEISDEGTGAGTYISQLVLFRKNDGTDYLAIASRSVEPVDYIWVSSPGPPSFYTFNGSSFDEVEGLLPELESGIFFPDSLETVSAQTYYVLPQKGLSISYNLNYDPVMDYCENRLDDLEDNMSPEDFAAKKKQCEVFGNLEKTQIELAFNKELGRFDMK
jgi:hypothetical protein